MLQALSDGRNSVIIDQVAEHTLSIAESESDRFSQILVTGEDTTTATRESNSTIGLARLALAEASLNRSGGITCFVSPEGTSLSP
jgi:hypothetical protein